MEAFIGTIMAFGGNFAPRGWAFCDGRLLPISQYTAVFALLGTIYGGNGQTNFALPDLRGRVAVGMGNGPGLSPVVEGQMGGTETVTLVGTQIPVHSHTVGASTAGGSVAPTNAFLAVPVDSQGGVGAGYTGSANTTLNPATIGGGGGNQPHENRQPYLGVNYIICLEGIFPSRN
jgi:microcystin-dependent protein